MRSLVALRFVVAGPLLRVLPLDCDCLGDGARFPVVYNFTPARRSPLRERVSMVAGETRSQDKYSAAIRDRNLLCKSLSRIAKGRPCE